MKWALAVRRPPRASMFHDVSGSCTLDGPGRWSSDTFERGGVKWEDRGWWVSGRGTEERGRGSSRHGGEGLTLEGRGRHAWASTTGPGPSGERRGEVEVSWVSEMAGGEGCGARGIFLRGSMTGDVRTWKSFWGPPFSTNSHPPVPRVTPVRSKVGGHQI